MNRQTAVRLAAPAAFLAGVTIAVLLVRAGLDDETTVAAPTAPARTAPATTRKKPAPKPKPKPARAVYATVEAGDTLDQIALEHDTTVQRLLELNPGLDPAALQVGQRVRVR